MLLQIGPLARDLMFGYETGGRPYYESKASRPHWPGNPGDTKNKSGVTIGAGYDLGYQSAADFRLDWGGLLPVSEIKRLETALGVRGQEARSLLPAFQDIVIPWSTAEVQFNERTLPRYLRTTLSVFPGASTLPPDALGILVSLVLNRGSSMSGPSRIEMRLIRESVRDRDFGLVPGHIRRMKRLWKDNPKSKTDLVDRREAEAAIFENSLAGTSAAPAVKKASA